MDNNYKIIDIITSQKDFHLLPRDKFGYCYYDGNLICCGSELKILPNKLHVKGYFNCSLNKIVSLPNDLIVGGFLDCSHNQLTSLPDDLNVNNCIYCDFNNITTEIKVNDSIEIIMDIKQRKQYERAIKLNKIITNIDG